MEFYWHIHIRQGYVSCEPKLSLVPYRPGESLRSAAAERHRKMPIALYGFSEDLGSTNFAAVYLLGNLDAHAPDFSRRADATSELRDHHAGGQNAGTHFFTLHRAFMRIMITRNFLGKHVRLWCICSAIHGGTCLFCNARRSLRFEIMHPCHFLFR